MPAEDDLRRDVLASSLTVGHVNVLSSTVTVDIAARSHRGRVQAGNDDHYLVLRFGRFQETLATSLPTADLPRAFAEYGYAMLVADGQGTGGAGSMASRLALSTIAQMLLRYGRWNLRVDPADAQAILERASFLFEQADEAVAAQSTRERVLADMATSLTAAYSAGDHLFLAHVGHSRAYLFRGGMLQQLTLDQTVRHHFASNGSPIVVERQDKDTPHVLTDAIGARRRPAIDVEHFRLSDGDTLLLCTNGLTDMVDDERIGDVLAQPRGSVDQCESLVELANGQGGSDNVTVVVARYAVPTSGADAMD